MFITHLLYVRPNTIFLLLAKFLFLRVSHAFSTACIYLSESFYGGLVSVDALL